MHALGARFATRVIDHVAYNGTNMRHDLASEMTDIFSNSKNKCDLLEVGCGVGTLTSELVKTKVFDNIFAVDTSPEMLHIAQTYVSGPEYKLMNGADVGQTYDVDVAIACMVMHELPRSAHAKLIKAMVQSVQKRRGEAWFIDIDPDYTPSETFLTGEPYATKYLKSIQDTFEEVCSEMHDVQYDTFQVIPSHVRGWVLRVNDDD